MDFGLSDKTVLVLASGSGLGKAVAGEFLKEGASVVISGRGEEKLAAAAEDLVKISGRRPRYYLPCDVTRTLAERKGLPVEDVSRASLSRIPLGRYGDPAEYGRLAVFLGSEANTYITGQTILADGGMVKAVP